MPWRRQRGARASVHGALPRATRSYRRGCIRPRRRRGTSGAQTRRKQRRSRDARALCGASAAQGPQPRSAGAAHAPHSETFLKKIDTPQFFAEFIFLQKKYKLLRLAAEGLTYRFYFWLNRNVPFLFFVSIFSIYFPYLFSRNRNCVSIFRIYFLAAFLFFTYLFLSDNSACVL